MEKLLILFTHHVLTHCPALCISPEPASVSPQNQPLYLPRTSLCISPEPASVSPQNQPLYLPRTSLEVAAPPGRREPGCNSGAFWRKHRAIPGDDLSQTRTGVVRTTLNCPSAGEVRLPHQGPILQRLGRPHFWSGDVQCPHFRGPMGTEVGGACLQVAPPAARLQQH